MFRLRLQPLGATLLVLLALTACDRNRPPTPETPTPPEPQVTTPAPTKPTALPDKENKPSAQADQVVIPGERVGPITATTSRQDLAAIYGEEALQDAPIPVGEGFTEPGTIVNLGPDRQISVVWQDASQNQPLYVTDFGPAWKTPEGLGVGTDLATLKTVLGPFQFYGFAWDYEGSLVLEGSKLDRYYGNLLLHMRPSPASAEANPDAYQQVIGDQLYKSDNPNLAPLDIRVYQMTVYLNSLPEE